MKARQPAEEGRGERGPSWWQKERAGIRKYPKIPAPRQEMICIGVEWSLSPAGPVTVDPANSVVQQ